MFVRKMFIMFFGAALTLFGQFGQNRVQYKDFDWYFIQTEHFDIYFTQNGKNVAEFTAHAAEEAYESLSSKLNYQLNNRLSLVVYDSHNDFQETNITDGYLSQGIGGFTEPFKNRVVFPFEGSYEKFRHVIAPPFTPNRVLKEISFQRVLPFSCPYGTRKEWQNTCQADGKLIQICLFVMP